MNRWIRAYNVVFMGVMVHPDKSYRDVEWATIIEDGFVNRDQRGPRRSPVKDNVHAVGIAVAATTLGAGAVAE